VKNIRDLPAALKAYAKQAGEGLDNQNLMAEIKLRAERRAGELLQDMEDARPGKKPTELGNTVLPNSAPTLAEVGITKMQSSRWQAVAKIPEEVFEDHIAETKAGKAELTTASVLHRATQYKREQHC
jgi:hypothetical protein